jgi:hypothetical protein
MSSVMLRALIRDSCHLTASPALTSDLASLEHAVTASHHALTSRRLHLHPIIMSLSPLTIDSTYTEIYKQLPTWQALLDHSKRFRSRDTTCHGLQTCVRTWMSRNPGKYKVGDRDDAYIQYGRAKGFLSPASPLPPAPALPLPRASFSLCDSVSPSITSSSAAVTTVFTEPATACLSSLSPSPAAVSPSPSPLSSVSALPLVLPTPTLPPSQSRLAYDPTLLCPAPELFREVLGPVSAVKITGDGRCWLRAIAVGVDPTLKDDDRRLAQVRSELRQELLDWGVERWMQRVPGYGLRELVRTSDTSCGNSSYDTYLHYLSDSAAIRYEHLDHCVFFLASSRYNVHFLILAQYHSPSELIGKPFVYHRLIVHSPIAQRTVFVLHHESHYQLLDININDASHIAAVAAISRQPPLVQHARRWTDADYQEWRKVAETQSCKRAKANAQQID